MGFRDYAPEQKANDSLQRLGHQIGELVRERHEAAELIDALVARCDLADGAAAHAQRFAKALRGGTEDVPADAKATAVDAIVAVRARS